MLSLGLIPTSGVIVFFHALILLTSVPCYLILILICISLSWSGKSFFHRLFDLLIPLLVNWLFISAAHLLIGLFVGFVGDLYEFLLTFNPLSVIYSMTYSLIFIYLKIFFNFCLDFSFMQLPLSSKLLISMCS